jgi:hypothetical protein
MAIGELLAETALRTGATSIMALIVLCLLLGTDIAVGVRIVAGIVGLPIVGVLGAGGVGCVQQLCRRLRG